MKIVIVSDLQVPFHSPKMVKNLATFIRKFKPDEVLCVGDEMDFNTISLKEAEKFGVLIKSLVDFISDKLIDYCYDDLESDSKTLIGLIIQLPTSLRGQIKFACDTKLKELRASR